ncbi:MAG: WecB/TagA/CpsF family glycosyltransferase [Deltaproteobacteria bacterium]|nr:WecB/TagA/CpsF family glycosyltransferase [Deltaproteobacteria bacterium]
MLPRDLPMEPRASLADVAAGRASLIGARTRIARRDFGVRAGVISPYETRARLGLRYGDPPIEEARYERARSKARDAGVLVRWALSHLMAWHTPSAAAAKPASPIELLSVRIDPLDTIEVIDRIRGWLHERRSATVCFVHAHALNLSARDATMREDLQAADLVLPDGVGVRLGAWMQGRGLPANVNGTDLVPELLLQLAADRIPVALIGAAPGVAERAARNWRAKANFELVGVWDGYRSDTEYREAYKEISAHRPAVVLLGFGSPLQERHARSFSVEQDGLVVITVGGLFDFAAHAVPRAPLAWRELGLEWVWRLAHEPRRLARRYLLGNPEFLARMAMQRMGHTPSAASD